MACAGQFDRIMAEARLRLPGAIDDVMKVELFSILDEFLRRTHIWQEDISVGVTTDNKMYELSSNEWVAAINELIRVNNKDAISISASMPVAGELLLYNYPSEDQTYSVLVSLALASAVDEDGYPQVPEWIIIKYHEAFKDGLLTHMLMQPAKPYYNETLAKYYGIRFRSSMDEAFYDVKSQNTFDGQSWIYPQNFVTRKQ